MLCSIVRTVSPDAVCSYPRGRREVQHLSAYRPCLHSHLTSHDVRLSMRGRTWEETLRQAAELADTFNRCCTVPGIAYHAEEVEDDSSRRAEPAY